MPGTETGATMMFLIWRWPQQRRLLARDVNQRNWVLTTYSLVYVLHFVSAVTPKKYQEI